MKISAFEMKVGNLMEYQGKLWRVLKTSHVKPGKGGAFVQAEMKEISVGTKINERFRSDEKLEKAHVEPRQMQYLYAEGDNILVEEKSSGISPRICLAKKREIPITVLPSRMSPLSTSSMISSNGSASTVEISF